MKRTTLTPTQIQYARAMLRDGVSPLVGAGFAKAAKVLRGSILWLIGFIILDRVNHPIHFCILVYPMWTLQRLVQHIDRYRIIFADTP